ncbi:hypothetical protein V8C43DRAFT_297795 [Trichoderma afarasin]
MVAVVVLLQPVVTKMLFSFLSFTLTTSPTAIINSRLAFVRRTTHPFECVLFPYLWRNVVSHNMHDIPSTLLSYHDIK